MNTNTAELLKARQSSETLQKDAEQQLDSLKDEKKNRKRALVKFGILTVLAALIVIFTTITSLTI